MTIRTLPQIQSYTQLETIKSEVPDFIKARWNTHIQAAKSDNAINIFDAIGEQYDGSGTTAKSIAAALSAFGDKDVTINLNSGGGSFFEGVAIYNMLREHPKKVTIKVMGLAASAASVIAMAADDLQVARTGFLMIHNAWIVAMGNRKDLKAAADSLEPFDNSMAELYASRTGMERKKIENMMDAETWIAGAQAVEMGFADSLLATDSIKESDDKVQSAIRRVDLALAKEGMTRKERRALLKEISSTPSAADEVTPSADKTVEALQGLLLTLKN
jgi:ATP-dependent protease ClpP protease subunit